MKRLAIIGGGVTAADFGDACHRLGYEGHYFSMPDGKVDEKHVDVYHEINIFEKDRIVYPDTVERVTVELLCPERSPLSVTLGGEALPRFLDRPAFEAAERGWYYSSTKRAALIRYPNPHRDLTLAVSFEALDPIGM